MSIDLIDIALERMTDFAGFEKLANEVMYLEGWVDIKALGGVADLGQDAVSERLYGGGGGPERTVFQYTLQEYLPGKVNDTIEKLRENKIDFNELVVVTPHTVSSEAQIRMKRNARADYGVSLDIYERKTLGIRLADLSNGIFSRHFPDIRAQREDVARAASRGALPEAALERALLQASLALTFRPESQRARKSVFDYFVLALILAEPNQQLTIENAAAKATTALKSNREVPMEQVAAAIGRLEKRRLVETSKGFVCPTEVALAEVAGGTVRLIEATSSFASDMVSAVRHALNKRLPSETERRVARNTREVLLEVARSRGTSPEDPLLSIDDRVSGLARHQLPEEIGNALTAGLAEALRSPTEDQAHTLARWTQTYLALAIMGLDPTLNAFQTSRFSKKTFILDTDIVLEALVTDGLRSAVLRALLESLLKMGSRIVIPESVLAECVEHAERSPKTYGYFGQTLLQLTPAVVEAQVWNAFVKGYYYARQSGRVHSSVGYPEYLANFYDARRPRRFLVEVVEHLLPKGIQIVSLEKLRPDELADKEIEEFAHRLQADLTGSKKSRFRTAEDEAKLALTDATLFLIALRLNHPDESTVADVLGGSCYLVTETPRYSRVARSSGISTNVTARPAALASLQELIGAYDVSPNDFVQLFDNPFLESAVDSVWPDVERLVRSGISVVGKSLPRLRVDLDDALHSHIQSFSATQQANDDDDCASEQADMRYLDLLKAAKKRGYSLIPEIEILREKVEAGEQDANTLKVRLDEVSSQNQVLQEQIAFFGKRRQRYLRRVASASSNQK